MAYFRYGTRLFRECVRALRRLLLLFRGPGMVRALMYYIQYFSRRGYRAVALDRSQETKLKTFSSSVETCAWHKKYT